MRMLLLLVLQIRSHAQKHFHKALLQGEEIPPPRAKRRNAQTPARPPHQLQPGLRSFQPGQQHPGASSWSSGWCSQPLRFQPQQHALAAEDEAPFPRPRVQVQNCSMSTQEVLDASSTMNGLDQVR